MNARGLYVLLLLPLMPVMTPVALISRMRLA